MKCSGCQTENPEQAKFCIECGSKLEFHCPGCGAVTPATGKFCMECGHKLKAEEPQKSVNYDQPHSYTPKHLADKILTHRSAIEGERKLVTVLFADVANFTAMSEKLDPEEVHQIMDGCFKILMDEIHRCEGTINQFTGDGVMALFGAPVAHEDHAQRACRAALAVQKALAEYGKKVRGQYGVPFQMRIGLNSGPVIVGAIGDDLRMDYTAVGDTTNMAARVEQHTEPEMVYLSRETRNITRDYFESESVGEMAFKGKTDPQAIYRLISEYSHVRNRFEAGLVRGVTELVGRKREIDELRTAFEKVKAGEAQIVDVVGEAGIGKSRLVYEFRESMAGASLFLTGLCMQYGGNINFLPVMDIARAAFGITQEMNESEAGRRIEQGATGSLVSMISFYRSLLSLKVDDPKFAALQPEGRKFGTFEAVKDLLIELSREKPLVIFVEDVHWIDKISEEFFTFFSRCIPEHPIMLLSAYRPEGAPPWSQGMHYHRLGLETLSSESSVHLVHNILGGLTMEPALEERIVEKTKGNPFFVEEIVRELVDRGDIDQQGDRYVSKRPINQLHIPNTVQAVLAARMDRLSEDLKHTMQVASVIGRDFAFKILKTILELGDELRGQLTNLVGLEILYEKALFPELEYIFKHALTQEVAYEALLKQRRRAIHGRIAQVIEEIYPNRLDEHYELLAHHYERSGNFDKTVHYLVLAAEKSNRQNAVQAAHGYLMKALGYVHEKALILDRQSELKLFHGLSLANVALGNFDEAIDTLTKTLSLCKKYGAPEYEKMSYFLLNQFSWARPDRANAMSTIDAGIERARELGDKTFECQSLSWKGLNECCYGLIVQGIETAKQAESVALKTNDPFSLFLVRFHRAFHERFLGNPLKTVELTEGMVESMGNLFNIASLSTIIFWRGIALAETGRLKDAFSILKHGLDLSLKYGPFWRHAALLNCLGYCYGEIYQSKKALALNRESEKLARKLFDENPMGRLMYGEIAIIARINIMENLYDMGKIDSACEMMRTSEKLSLAQDYDLVRHVWSSRMRYLAAQMLLQNNSVEEAEALATTGLEQSRAHGHKKREGCFLRILGEVKARKCKFDSAVENFNRALGVLGQVGNPRKLWEAHACLADTFEKMGRSCEARDHWGAAASAIQRLSNDLLDRETKLEFLSATQTKSILAKFES